MTAGLSVHDRPVWHGIRHPDIVFNGRSPTLPLDHPDCAGRAEGWRSRFDIGSGPLLGFQAGYAWRSLRFEAEFLHCRHVGNGSDSTITAGGVQAEFVYGGERLREIQTDALYGNV